MGELSGWLAREDVSKAGNAVPTLVSASCRSTEVCRLRNVKF